MNFINKVKDKLKRAGIKITAIGAAIATLGTSANNFSLNKEASREIEHQHKIETETNLDLVNTETNLEDLHIELGNNSYSFNDEITADTVEVEQKNFEAKETAKKIEKATVKKQENTTPRINIGNYNGNSIVEALTEAGYDSSVESRKKIAKQYNVKNYDTSAEKNIELLNTLKEEAKSLKTEQKSKKDTINKKSTNTSKKKNKKEKHKHDYKLISQKYRINDNGTHTLIKKSKCSDCKKVKNVKKTVKHKFSKFKAFDDKYEKAKCECGKEKIREHKYSEWIEDKNGFTESCVCKTCGHKMKRVKAVLLEKLVENVDYIKTVTHKDNGDGTHSIETKYKWINSSGSLTIITKEAHNQYSNWESSDDEKEARNCICGYKEERNHDYGEAKDNGNGTEDLTCKNCNHTMTREKDKTNNITPMPPIYPGGSIGPVSPGGSNGGNTGGNNNNNGNNSHEHDFVQKNVTYEVNEKGHVKIITYVCKKDGKEKTDRIEEMHKAFNWRAFDDDKEVAECECGKKEYRDHKHSNWVANSDGLTESCVCINCGHVKTRDIQKGHEHSWIEDGEIYYESTEKEHIAKQNYKCSDSNCTEKITKTIKKEAHTLTKWTVNPDGITESSKCEICGRIITRDIQKEHEHNWIEDGEIYYETTAEGHIAKQNFKCSDPNCTERIEKTGELEKHTDEITYSSDKTKEIHTCTICGNVSEKDHIHMPEYKGQQFTGDPTNPYCKVPYGKCECGEKKVLYDLLDQNPAYGTLHKWNEETGRCEYCRAKKPEKEHEHSWIEDGEIYYETTSEGHIAKQSFKCSDPNCTERETKTGELEKHTDEITYSSDKTKEIHTCTICENVSEKDHIHIPEYAGQQFTGDPTNQYCRVPIGKCECGEKKVLYDLLDQNPAYGTLHKWNEETGRCEYCRAKNPEMEKYNNIEVEPVYQDISTSTVTTTGSAITVDSTTQNIPEDVTISVINDAAGQNIEATVDAYLNSLENYGYDSINEENYIRRK